LKFLPSKKFAFVFGTLLLAAGVFYLFNRVDDVPAPSSDPVISLKEATFYQDTDGDGLEDWEEVLWKTDPRNPDTDGDGTPDGEEVKAGRDPAKPAPDDAVASPQKLVRKTNNDAPETENLTRKIASDFISTYMRRKFASAANADALDLDALQTAVFNEIKAVMTEEAQKKIPDAFSRETISITNSSTEEEIKSYINTVGSILQNPPHTTTPGAQELILKAFEEENIHVLAGMQSHAENYMYFVEKLKDIAAPLALADAHAALLNNLQRLETVMQSLAAFPDDPVRGFAALAQYDTVMKESLIPLGALVDEIKRYQLTFNETEGGSLFAKYVALRQ